MKQHPERTGFVLGAGVLCLLLAALVAPLAAADTAAATAGNASAGTVTTTDPTSSTGTGSGASTSSTATGSGVSVESTTLNPGTFFTGDTGTLAVRVANHGTNAVRIVRAGLSSNEFSCLNADTYAVVGTLEPGATRDLTFTLQANAGNGVYYPDVEIDLGDAGSIRYAVPIRIDNTPVQVSLADAPSSYMKDQANTVTVAVANPRQSTINGVSVAVSGANLSVSDTAGFVGALGADQSRNVSFDVTPRDSTTLTLTVSYRNGLSDHSTVLTVPMTVGSRSTAADPVVNGVEVTASGGTYTLSGDVTNAGIMDARGVVVTVGSPATPTDPNKNYVVGSLAADDFASFDLTFTANGARAVPLLVQYRDDDGNTFEETVEVTLSGTATGAANASAGSAQAGPASNGFQGGPPAGAPGGGSMFGLFGGGRPGSSSGTTSLPIVPIVGAVVLLLVLGVAWKRGLVAKAGVRLRQARSAAGGNDATSTDPTERTDEQLRE